MFGHGVIAKVAQSVLIGGHIFDQQALVGVFGLAVQTVNNAFRALQETLLVGRHAGKTVLRLDVDSDDGHDVSLFTYTGKPDFSLPR